MTVEAIIRQLSRETGLPVHMVYDFYNRVSMGADPYEVAEALNIPEDKMIDIHRKLFGRDPGRNEIVLDIPEEQEKEKGGGKKKKVYTEEERLRLYEKIKELWDKGYTKKQIVEELRTNYRMVSQALRHYGIDPRTGKRIEVKDIIEETVRRDTRYVLVIGGYRVEIIGIVKKIDVTLLDDENI